MIVSKSWVIVMLVAGGLLSAAARAKGMDARQCERLCLDDVRDAASYPEVLRRLLSRKPACERTVIYEVRLSMAYSFNGEYTKAKRVLEPYQGSRDYAAMVELALLYARYRLRSATRTDATGLERALSAFVERHPGVPEASETLGYVRILLGQCGPAVRALEASLPGPLNQVRVYRALTMCYVEEGRYADAVRAANLGSREGGWGKDPTFAQYTAAAFMALRQCDVANAILFEMIEANPELRGDQDVVKLVGLLEKCRASAPSRSRGPNGYTPLQAEPAHRWYD